MGNVTAIKVQPMVVSWGGSAIGFTDGDIDFKSEEKVVDITAHQEGTNVLTSIRTGKSAELSLKIKEVSIDMVQYLFGQGGYVGQASGASGGTGSQVVAWGRSKDFSRVTDQAQKLVLHPNGNLATNRSEDIAAWVAYPVVDSVSYSGEKPTMISVTFKIYPDFSKADPFRLFVIGDHLNGNFNGVGP